MAQIVIQALSDHVKGNKSDTGGIAEAVSNTYHNDCEALEQIWPLFF